MFDNLQRKPEGERRLIAFTAAAIITGIILLIWLSIIFSQPSTEESLDGPDFADNIGTSFSLLGEKVSDLSEGISKLFGTFEAVQDENSF